MRRLCEFFLCGLFLCALLDAEDISIDTPRQIVPPPPKNNNYNIQDSSIAQIRNKQELIRKKSGKYIGIGIGGVEIKKDYQNKSHTDSPAIFSIKSGVQTFFNKNIGIRGFFDLDMATGMLNYQWVNDPSRSFYAMFSLGIDMIGEFPLNRSYKHFLGFFGGLGGGGVIYTDNGNFSLFKDAIYTAGLMIEGGVTLSIFIKHRIEFGIKILPTVKTLLNSGRFETSLMPYIMYNYKF
ncbi:outer membrane beta-barrel protein [Helicobacter sp. 11S03491-1]|uniref:outer membrane beta-barrel protein n=1 Tax=Helicobacter sp. 11S03491-1 TaxID=1476196 RepID=UPI000BA52439|nr:outer membrane beta-barrel protein [Helicobacter sp. 11S03491-1]PAF43353.1 hypothetical protein BKH45_01560 [Helicobacter sp. 11S03491-1]